MTHDDFQIIDLPNGSWAVGWPEWKPVTDTVTAIKLFELVVKCNTGDRIGFGVVQGDQKESTYWIESMLLFREDYYEQLADYLVSTFDITGVVFQKEEDSRALKFELDKLLTWYQLKTNYDNLQNSVA